MANLLTLGRLCATPFVIWLLLGATASMRYGALALFIIAMLTDLFDGALARRHGGTVLGNYLDPVADKVLILSVFFALSQTGLLPLWMSLVMLAREIVVSGVRDAAATGGRVVGANWMGKTKTFLQALVICWALFFRARTTESASPAGLEYVMLWWFACLTTVMAAVFAGVFLYWHRILLTASPKR